MTFETPDDDKTPVARAYVYHGEWVADCPRGCGNVEFLYQATMMNGPRTAKKPFYHCSNCGMQALIDWPDNEMEILRALVVRPVPDNRNWYPKDHPVAINFRIAHGQSVKDLESESEEHGVR